MNVLKRVDINSYKSNTRFLSNPSIRGIHFSSYESLPTIEEKLKKYPNTNKIIVYEATQDTIYSAEHLVDTSSRIIKSFPNFMINLDDPELTLFIKEILCAEGKRIKTITDIDKSCDGDYLLLKRKQTRKELLALLKDKRKVLLNALDYQNEMDFLEEVTRTNIDSVFVSTWSLKLLK